MADRKHELSALLSSATLVMIGGFASSVAKLAERIVVGRLLSPAAYGEASIGLALLMFVVTISLAGCTQGVSRFVPRYDPVEDRRGIWVSGLLVTATLSIVFGAILFLFAGVIATHLFETDEAARFVRILALSMPFIAGFRIAVAGIRGYENTIYKTVIENLLDPFLRIGLITLLILAGMGYVAVGFAYLLAAVAAFGAAHLLLNRLMPLYGEYRLHVRELLVFSMPLVVSTVIGILLTHTDTLMLGYFRDSYEVGLYNAAYPIATGLTVVLSAFGFLYLPIASRLDAEDDRDEVDAIYATSTRWVYIITFPLFLLLVVFPNDVIAMVFGSSYTSASSVLPLLAVGFFLSTAVGRDRETLSAVGATTWIAIGNLVGLTLNVLLNLFLIPRYGFMGAGVASVTSLFTLHAVILGTLAIRYDITPISPEAIRCYVSLPAALIPAAVLLSPWIHISAVTVFPFLVAAGGLSLVVVGVVDGFEPEDVVVINLVEDTFGVTIPLVRRWIPDAGGEPFESFARN